MKTARRKSPSVPLWSLGRLPLPALNRTELRTAAAVALTAAALSGCGDGNSPSGSGGPGLSAAAPVDTDGPVVMQNAYDTRDECAATWGEENCVEGFNPEGDAASAPGAQSAAARSGSGAHPVFMPSMGRYLGPRYFYDHAARAAYMIRPNGGVAPVPTQAAAMALNTLQARGAATAGKPSSVTRGGFGGSARAASSGGG